MKKFIGLTVLFFFAAGFLTADISMEEKSQAGKALPKVGSIYRYSGAEWYVRGVGDKPFEYTATGESLCMIIRNVSGASVFIPEKGEVVRVDPAVPMVYINNKEKEGWRANSYLMKHAKDQVHILLEYKR